MDTNIYVERLFNEWKQHKAIIIAVDWDDTLNPWKFESNGYDELFDLLIKCKKVGAYIVIHTACNPDRYSDIRNICESKGLIIDSFNETPIDLPYGKYGSKIYANIFLDDRAGLEQAKQILTSAMYEVINFQRNIGYCDIDF